ncbi:MAG: carbamoyltransferase [Gammaproteobacteria bacterium]|jgi:carbamoyltransferase
MRICGIKFGHDGAIAVIEDGRLLASIELEKLDNQSRHCPLHDMNDVFRILTVMGLSVQDIDHFAIDGWHAHSRNLFAWNTREHHLPRAAYLQTPLDVNLLAPLSVKQLEISYRSWPHYAGHALGAYCSSPFSAARRSSYLLSWDGGMVPYLYYFDAAVGAVGTVHNIGPLFSIVGDLYAEIAAGRGPFNANPTGFESLGTPGKIMAYVAYGTAREDLIDRFRKYFDTLPALTDATMASNYEANLDILRQIRADDAFNNADDNDVITSYHTFIQIRLLESLHTLITARPELDRRLCFAGGCALNIKWNQAIRNSAMFEDMWVPPFPNDAGSALGAACCAMIVEQGRTALDWSVYSGPPFLNDERPQGWSAEDCKLDELARILHEEGKPILFLDGNAEIGPRALGNRSILAPANGAAMKRHLNEIKNREDYRPVAPICLEQYASEVFDPGSSDPYMLYDHKIREDWRQRVPAIMHKDGTARLQTVNAQQHPKIHTLLSAYHALSGVPLLCNTSANLNQKGFFPDLQSAVQWGGATTIWSDGKLYRAPSTDR